MEVISLLKNGRFNGIDCEKMYSRYDNGMQHYNEKHRNIRKVCPICQKLITHKSFARHVKNHKKPNKDKRFKINCSLEINTDGRISSEIVEVAGSKFALMPIKESNKSSMVEVGSLNNLNGMTAQNESEQKTNKSIIEVAYENAITGIIIE